MNSQATTYTATEELRIKKTNALLLVAVGVAATLYLAASDEVILRFIAYFFGGYAFGPALLIGMATLFTRSMGGYHAVQSTGEKIYRIYGKIFLNVPVALFAAILLLIVAR
jgi:hypothetical protein